MRVSTVFLAALAIALGQQVLAQGAPALLSYQGQLTNSVGAPITSPAPVRFTLFWGGTPNENPSTGTPVYQEDATVVPDAGGVFNHLIGAGAPTSACDEDRDGTAAEPCVLAPDDFPDAATAVLLEIRVDPGGVNDPLLPRQRIASVAYALNADTVDGQEAATLASGPKSMVIDSGVISVPESTTGYVGPIDLDGFDVISYSLLGLSAPPSSFFQIDVEWSNDTSSFGAGDDCTISSGSSSSVCFDGNGPYNTNYSSGVVVSRLYNIRTRFMRLRHSTSTTAGTYTFKVVLYLRRLG